MKQQLKIEQYHVKSWSVTETDSIHIMIKDFFLSYGQPGNFSLHQNGNPILKSTKSVFYNVHVQNVLSECFQ